MDEWKSINYEIDSLYNVSKEIIIPKHNYLEGSKSYVISTLEHLIGALNQNTINDDLVLFLSKSIIELIDKGEDQYFEIIRDFNRVLSVYDNVEQLIEVVKNKYRNNVLTTAEKIALKSIIEKNVSEYLMKSDCVKIDYSAMKTMSLLAYEVITNGLTSFVWELSIIVDTDGILEKWKPIYSDKVFQHIWIEWISSDKIDHYFQIYDVNCVALLENSKYELASADVFEEQYIQTDKRQGSYGLIVKQVCGVIEQELNHIIKLIKKEKAPKKHLMWDELKKYIKSNDIQLVEDTFDLFKMLNELHHVRNLAMHGELIQKCDFDKLNKYRKRQLFEFISWTKLDLLDKVYYPSVHEISMKFDL